jgi:hypothetical protein
LERLNNLEISLGKVRIFLLQLRICLGSWMDQGFELNCLPRMKRIFPHSSQQLNNFPE